MQANDKVTMGLISFTRQDGMRLPKSPDQLLTEIKLARAAGSKGLLIFNLDHLSDEQLKALTADAPSGSGNNN